MIIKPMLRSNMCFTSHPEGCDKIVKEQIDYVFRRYIDKNCIVIGKAIVEFEGGDWYAIY